MKKIVLLFSAIALVNCSMYAQQKATVKSPVTEAAKTAPVSSTPKSPRPDVKAAESKLSAGIPAAAQPTQGQNADASMKFVNEEHNFGNVPEGPSVTTDFEFKNIGKEPIVLSNVQASCGCTTPSWTKEPVMPGKTGKISATYNTQGRPGPIMKTITVTSNVGTKVVKITGNVEKAPESSVPANENSMMRH
jgi:hypothetical protein